MPSPTTINRRAKKYGHKLKQFLPDCVAGTDADAVIPDGTKCHSQDDDRSSHSVQATLGEDTAEASHAPCWICRSTLTGTKLPPNSMISAQSLTTRRSSVTLIAASSQPLPTKTVTTSLISSTSAERWVTPSGTMASSLGPSEGDRFEVIDEVFHLKNSVAKHRPAEEFAAIRSRIARTRAIREDSVATGAVRVSKGCRVSSAVAAVDCDVRRARCRGFEVPWTSNPVERLMGEVSKRCKNQWMRWTAEGLKRYSNFGW